VQEEETMRNPEVRQARLSETLDYIIDSDGWRVEYDDPRIVHVGAVDGSPYTKRLMKKIYEKHKRKLRTISATTAESMQAARRFCSGRECVPMTAMAGAVLNDLEQHRREDELCLYFTLDQSGPCQNGAWPVVWETIARRLNMKNVIFGVWPGSENHRLGLGDDIVNGFISCYMLGDLIDEAKNTLRVVAREPSEALSVFDAAFKRLARCFSGEDEDVTKVLKNWAETMSAIPRRADVEDTPRVLLFGGLNLQFVHYPLTKYFIEQGVIPKVVDATEGMLWLTSEKVLRYAFRMGRTDPKKQYDMLSLILSWLAGKGGRREAAGALKSRIGMLVADRMIKRFRKIMLPSNLMVDAHVSYTDLAVAGHRYVTYNGFTETAVTTGRYVHAVKTGLYDGLINVGSFNCQPAMNAQAIIRPLANKDDMPYAAIDCEGPWLSANQKRLLEAVAVQAGRARREKLKG
jgi:predicted nucleotide-binding protein (sugar kinase/HSP70/actin superfamily)